MNIQDYFEKIQNVQQYLLSFLESDEGETQDYQNFFDFIKENKIQKNKHALTLFLQLVSQISNDHNRDFKLNLKVESILRNLIKFIKVNFSIYEIFKVFKNNKRILLFLLEEKILIMDKCIVQKIITTKYLESDYLSYFLPEIKPFMIEEWFQKSEFIDKIPNRLPENFYELRREGENESFICKLIRNDSIDDFIIFVTKNNYSLRSTIKSSIYETNSFLIKKQIESQKSPNSYENKLTLIKYAAFFGSFQIFKYLQLNGIEFTPDLWNFAIHGKNAEIIHILEENHVRPNNNSYNEYLEESIKCHHNDIVNYLLNVYFINEEEYLNSFLIQSIKYYNFTLIKSELINKSSFFYFCQYNYLPLINIFLIANNIDVNEKTKIENSSDITALYIAIENENIDVVKLLLANDEININILNIFNFIIELHSK